MLIRAVALNIGFCLLAWPSAAQTPPETQTPSTEPSTPTPFNIVPPSRPSRPYRGVFGMPRENSEPRLTLEASAGGGMSGDPVRDQAIGTPGGSGAAGGGSGAGTGSANLVYSWTRQRMGIEATNVVFADYYPRSSEHNLLSRYVGTGTVYFVPIRSMRVTATETFKNLPEVSLADLHGDGVSEVIPANQAFGLTVDRYTRSGTVVEVNQKLAKRSHYNLGVDYGHGKVATREWKVVLFSGTFTQEIGKGLAVYGGYQAGGQRDARPGVQSVYESRPRLNFGVDFARALSFTRRTTLSFSTGTAGVHDRTENTTIYHLVGGAKLDRELGRTWNAALHFSRNVRYIEILPDPIFSDSLGVVVGGSLTRRVDVKAVFGSTKGHLGAEANTVDSTFGSAQLSYGLSRNLALGADYLYSRLSYVSGTLPIDESRQLPQHSLRAYVKVWAPLVSRPKRQ